MNPTQNLEDKVRQAGEGDVTITINQQEAEKVLEAELQWSLEETTPTILEETEQTSISDANSVRPTRERHSTRKTDYKYD